jgi:hypothetical protein
VAKAALAQAGYDVDVRDERTRGDPEARSVDRGARRAGRVPRVGLLATRGELARRPTSAREGAIVGGTFSEHGGPQRLGGGGRGLSRARWAAPRRGGRRRGCSCARREAGIAARRRATRNRRRRRLAPGRRIWPAGPSPSIRVPERAAGAADRGLDCHRVVGGSRRRAALRRRTAASRDPSSAPGRDARARCRGPSRSQPLAPGLRRRLGRGARACVVVAPWSRRHARPLCGRPHGGGSGKSSLVRWARGSDRGPWRAPRRGLARTRPRGWGQDRGAARRDGLSGRPAHASRRRRGRRASDGARATSAVVAVGRDRPPRGSAAGSRIWRDLGAARRRMGAGLARVGQALGRGGSHAPLRKRMDCLPRRSAAAAAGDAPGRRTSLRSCSSPATRSTTQHERAVRNARLRACLLRFRRSLDRRTALGGHGAPATALSVRHTRSPS